MGHKSTIAKREQEREDSSRTRASKRALLDKRGDLSEDGSPRPGHDVGMHAVASQRGLHGLRPQRQPGRERRERSREDGGNQRRERRESESFRRAVAVLAG